MNARRRKYRRARLGVVVAAYGLDEVPEEVIGLGILVAVANFESQKSIEATRHKGELEVTVHLHGHR